MRKQVMRWFVVSGALVIGLVIGLAIRSGGSGNVTASGTLSATHTAIRRSETPNANTGSPTPTPTPTPIAEPSPNAKGSGSCSYTLANDPSGNNYLTGEVDITNTGNIGVTVAISISWPQEGFAPVTKTRTVNIPFGAIGMPVSFNSNAGSINGGSNIIDNLQAWEQGHPDSTNDCTYRVVITGTYGKVGIAS